MEQGAINFGKWFARTMDQNGWSHPNLVALCRIATGGNSWLHSSQIAGLRQARLKSPGPRSFVALEYLWRAMDEYQKDPEKASFSLLSTQYPLIGEAEVMRDPDGNPATTGYMIEVFAGLRPVPIEMSELAVSLEQAKLISRNLGRIIRRMMAAKGWDLIDDMEKVTKVFSNNPNDRMILDSVIVGQHVLTPAEIDQYSADLARVMYRNFDYKREPNELIEEMMKKPL